MGVASVPGAPQDAGRVASVLGAPPASGGQYQSASQSPPGAAPGVGASSSGAPAGAAPGPVYYGAKAPAGAPTGGGQFPGPAGPPGPPPPPKKGLDDLFGPMGSNINHWNLSWRVLDESLVYSRRDLANIKIRELPTDATHKRSWDLATATTISAIDKSAQDILTRWIMLALNPLGDAWSVCQALHNNSQGLPQLDRFLGHIMMSDPNIANKSFGLSMSSYVEHCHHQAMAPRGRVLVALVSLRYRLDASRGNVLNQLHLMNIPLTSYKLSDIKQFVERVRMSLANIPVNEIQDR